MPATTAYLDSYNAGVDRIHTSVMSTVFSPDNTRLMAADDQGRLGLFYSSPQISSKPILLTSVSNTPQTQLNSTSLNNTNNSISLASSATGILIVVNGSSQNGLIQGYRWSDIISNKKTSSMPSDVFSFDLARGPNETFACVQAPSKSQQQQKGDEILVGSSTGVLRVLNIERQTLVTTIDAAHRGTVHQVAFANDGKRIASCSEDGTCKIWDLSTSSHQPIHTIETNKWISCCAFDMATDRLVIGGDCPLTLWHLSMLSSSNKQKPLLVYNSIPTPIYSLALCSADDDTILVGGDMNKLYSVPKNGDEQSLTISRVTTPSPIYTIATTLNNTTAKTNEEIKIVVAGSHWHMDSFTMTDANIRKIGHYEFSK
ncbi:unnamed protein product [Adineta ricciae]|uniref:Uncharacterized protein n=1 Tax=Adineta ricciae TaxID=249248 RepID=A0A814TRF8_ADIRI|nr:unnamed protein product [Adineta ricciae]CAF1163452.1 unnamed protein product [Adineta ricciae]